MTVIDIGHVAHRVDVGSKAFLVKTGFASFALSRIQGGPVLVYKPSGVFTSYKASADTAAARGTALQAAKAAAVSGDLIVVGPGDYDTNNLLKDGVSYFFYPGAQVVYTGSASGAIFGDNGTALTAFIGGFGAVYT